MEVRAGWASWQCGEDNWGMGKDRMAFAHVCLCWKCNYDDGHQSLLAVWKKCITATKQSSTVLCFIDILSFPISVSVPITKLHSIPPETSSTYLYGRRLGSAEPRLQSSIKLLKASDPPVCQTHLNNGGIKQENTRHKPHFKHGFQLYMKEI